MNTPVLQTQQLQFKKAVDETWTTVDIDPTEKLGSYLVANAENDVQYDVRMRLVSEDGIEKFSETITVTPSAFTFTPSSFPEFKLQQWYEEVKDHSQLWKSIGRFDNSVDNPFRHVFIEQINALVGNTGNTITVTPSSESATSLSDLEQAVQDANSGDTIIVSAGTYLIDEDWIVSKKVRIECEADVIFKRADYDTNGYTTSSSLIILNENIYFDGNGCIIDSNVAKNSGWADNGAGERNLIRVNNPSIVKNCTGINQTNRIYSDSGNTNYGGMRIFAMSYIENVISDGANRGFQASGTGFSENPWTADNFQSLGTFNGVYFYKCTAKHYVQKGFGTSGNNGFVVFDECDGSSMPFDEYHENNEVAGIIWGGPETLFILESNARPEENTRPRTALHTAIFRRCTINGFFSWKHDKGADKTAGTADDRYDPTSFTKSSGVKWVIYDRVDITTHTHITTTERIYQAQCKDGQSISGGNLGQTWYLHTDVIMLDSLFKIGKNPPAGYPPNTNTDVSQYIANTRTAPVISSHGGDDFYNGYPDPHPDINTTRTKRHPNAGFWLDNCTIELEQVKSWSSPVQSENVWYQGCSLIVNKDGSEAYLIIETGDTQRDGMVVFNNTSFLNTDGGTKRAARADVSGGGFSAGNYHIVNCTGEFNLSLSGFPDVNTDENNLPQF